MNNTPLALDFYITSVYHVMERSKETDWSLAQFRSKKHFVLGFSCDGKADYQINGDNYSIEKGDVLFFSPKQLRSARSSAEEPWHFITVSFEIQFQDPESEAFLYELPCVFLKVADRILQMGKELNHVWTGKRTGYLLKSRSILQEVLYLLIEQQTASRLNRAHYREISRIQSFMQEHYEQNFCIRQLARMTNFSESHFRRIFHQVTGMTVIQYANLVKINKAKDLISSGEANVTKAAVQTGFKDIYYFSRLFKHITGEKPSDYRNR